MKKIEKPAHLQNKYGSQFQDESVATAYQSRPPYPPETFEILVSLGNKTENILELGAGTGDLTIELARRVKHIDAVEPSAAMLKNAFNKADAQRDNLHWHQLPAERFSPIREYDLVCAGQSLHWMDWYVVLPKIAGWLVAGGFLAIVERQVIEHPWNQALYNLISHYSTNRDFVPYDLVSELTSRGLFREVGRQMTEPVAFEQTMEQYIESFHSRNGFSRERMEPEKAAEFDAAVRAIVEPYSRLGQIYGQVTGIIIWGHPL
ncbi:MAG: class I SAM-dependent methyltransferase [Candidatus Promineifilaceae bacterium]|nr:class I SAM-dependent methyltransferase [Candidatus Promineifilaceae bacterium]